MANFIWGEGTAPAGASGATTEQATLPAWYQEYLRGSINKASSIAGKPYTQYTSPRIAGFSDDTLAGYGAVRDMQGSYEPGMTAASNFVSKGGTFDRNDFTENFLNPNMSAVYDDMARRSNQNLFEKVLPGVNNTFTGGGQFGSSRTMDFNNRAIRDQQDTLAGQMATAGQAAYDSSMKNYGDASNRNISAGTNLANITTATQGAGYKDAAALDAIGREIQKQEQANLDLGYKDFENQQNYQKENADWLAGIIRGYPVAPTGGGAVEGATQEITGGSPLAAFAGGITAGASAAQPQVNRKRGGLVSMKKGCR